MGKKWEKIARDEGRVLISSLRNLCVLCASAVTALSALSPQRGRGRRDYAEKISVGHQQEGVIDRTSDAIIVNVLKYDGREYRRWPARIAKTDGPLLVLDAVFDEEIKHDLLGTISSGTISTEYYWLDRWYNVFRFSDPQQQVKNYYCNINVPPSFDGRVLSYIDLDIDVLVEPDLTYRILDEDDFEQNAKRYPYPEGVQANARGALAELLGLIESRSFPFNT